MPASAFGLAKAGVAQSQKARPDVEQHHGELHEDRRCEKSIARNHISMLRCTGVIGRVTTHSAETTASSTSAELSRSTPSSKPACPGLALTTVRLYTHSAATRWLRAMTASSRLGQTSLLFGCRQKDSCALQLLSLLSTRSQRRLDLEHRTDLIAHVDFPCRRASAWPQSMLREPAADYTATVMVSNCTAYPPPLFWERQNHTSG